MAFYFGFVFIIIPCVALLPTAQAIDDCFKLEGYIVPVFTPFDKYGALDTDVICAYAQYLKGVGANGVVVAATTGEGPSLNVSENKKLLDAWMEAAEPLDLYVVSSVGAVPLPEAQEMTKYSEEIGVDAIFVLPEVYYKPKNAEELVNYLELLYPYAMNTPMVYDDIPEDTGVYVDIVKFFELATLRIPTFMGVKSNVFENLILLRTKPKGQQKLYAANYFYLASQVCLGFKNYVLREFNLFPKLITDIIRYREKGYISRSTNLYQRLLDLIDIIIAKGYELAAEKEAFVIITGIQAGYTRIYGPLSIENQEALRQNLLDENVKLAQCDYD